MKITPPYSDDWWDRHNNSPHPHCKDFVLKIKVIAPFTILGFDSSETAGFKTRDSCFRNLVATNELPRQRISLQYEYLWGIIYLFDFLTQKKKEWITTGILLEIRLNVGNLWPWIGWSDHVVYFPLVLLCCCQWFLFLL